MYNIAKIEIDIQYQEMIILANRKTTHYIRALMAVTKNLLIIFGCRYAAEHGCKTFHASFEPIDIDKKNQTEILRRQKPLKPYLDTK